jgi:hypothetical protein
MDAGLLGALLETRYRHGSRSFEKIVDGLRRGGAAGFRRSALPSDEVLEMNVENLPAFKALMDRRGRILPHAARLAAAMHARWLGTASRRHRFARAFDALPPEIRGDNMAAALRIADILALAGLEMVPKDDPRPPLPGVRRVLARHLEALAEEEHRGWMDVRLKNGWRPCDRSTDADVRRAMRDERRSDCLVAYRELPEAEREKDRDAIRWYPQAASLAGLKIVAIG